MGDIWQMLEQEPPAGCEAVQGLYSWSLNYDAGRGPFPAFLDLIGWSEDEYGGDLYDWNDRSLGHLELSKLAAALEEYASAPYVVNEYVSELMTAEMADDRGAVTEGTLATLLVVAVGGWICSQIAYGAAQMLGMVS